LFLWEGETKLSNSWKGETKTVEFLGREPFIPVNLHFLISNFISGVYQKESGERDMRGSGKSDMRERDITERKEGERTFFIRK
jgi:hypothetical protein